MMKRPRWWFVTPETDGTKEQVEERIKTYAREHLSDADLREVGITDADIGR